MVELAALRFLKLVRVDRINIGLNKSSRQILLVTSKPDSETVMAIIEHDLGLLCSLDSKKS